MAKNSSLSLRQLIPKSYSFDGFNIFAEKDTRHLPFFSEKEIRLGIHSLKTTFNSSGNLILWWRDSYVDDDKHFAEYELSFNSFVNLLNDMLDHNRDYIVIKIKPKSNSYASDVNTYLRNRTFDMAISFQVSEVRKALDEYYDTNHFTNNKKYTGGKNKMRKNNMFGLNLEIGLEKNPNIRSTMMGVAIRSDNGSWRIYHDGNITDLGNMQFGNFPVYKLPAATLEPGDLIKMDGKYYYVKSFAPDEVQVIDVATSEVKIKKPIKNFMLGTTFYTKVVAIDMNTFKGIGNGGKSVTDNIMSVMMLCAFNKKNNSDEPFSLDDLKDDSTFDGMGPLMFALANSGAGGIGGSLKDANGNINPLFLMTLCNDDSCNDEMTQYMIWSQLLTNGTIQLPNFSNGMTVATAPATTTETKSEETSGNEMKCPKCGRTYSKEVKFCPKCGVQVVAIVKNPVCRKCGTILHEGDAFCYKCGAKVGPRTCPKCGVEVADDAKFCSKCGTEIAPTIPIIVATPNTESNVEGTVEPAAVTDKE